MRLWIVRHGKAEQVSASGRDEDRRLVDRGRRQASWLGQDLAGRKKRPSLVLSSNLNRAVETARLIAAPLDRPIEIVAALATGHSVSEAIDLIAARLDDSGLMVVGHNPTLAELAWVLEHGPPALDAGLRTGEAVVLDFDDGFGVGRGRLRRRLRLEDD